jgi:hypothetical protein
MHQSNRTALLVDQINRAAVGNVNAEANAALICDQSITILKAFVRGQRLIDNADITAMHLPRGHERRRTKTIALSNFAMNTIQPGKRFRFIVRHLDPRHP